MNIGAKIKLLRKEKRITQEELAEYLHISSQAISKWETGASCPDIDILPKLAIFFGTFGDAVSSPAVTVTLVLPYTCFSTSSLVHSIST